MKKIGILSAALLLLLTGACTKENTRDTTPLVAPDAVLLPRDGYSVDLVMGQDVIFEWDCSLGGNVRYQLVFDREGGDFSNPTYALLSDNSGIMTQATVSAKMLASAGKASGGNPGETITVLWNIRTFKGGEFVTGVLQGKPRRLTLTLPLDMDTVPQSVQMTGTAVENGSRTMEHYLPVSEDLNMVITLRSEGVFNAFIRMGEGTLLLTDERDRHFVLGGDGMVRQQLSDTPGSSPVRRGLVRLSVNFNKMTWEAVGVKDVWFWNFPWKYGGAMQARMNYAGDGVWVGVKDHFYISWDEDGQTYFDSRYYFRLDYEDDVTGERLGYAQKNCETGDPMDHDPGFYNVYRYRDFQADLWAYTWKTRDDREGRDMKATATLTLRGENYTHALRFE